MDRGGWRGYRNVLRLGWGQAGPLLNGELRERDGAGKGSLDLEAAFLSVPGWEGKRRKGREKERGKGKGERDEERRKGREKGKERAGKERVSILYFFISPSAAAGWQLCAAPPTSGVSWPPAGALGGRVRSC